MHNHLLDHEIKMLNQIAANFAWDSDEERAATTIASHIRRFWTPVMREQVTQANAAADIGLSPLARRALDLLA